MRSSRVIRIHQGQPLGAHFASGVALHGHTLHSKESVGFMTRLVGQSSVVRQVVEYQHKHRTENYALEDEFRRTWWTPPLSAAQAVAIERNQIEDALGLAPLVSLTDHDTLDAPLGLREHAPFSDVPLSTEWTVFFGDTHFHLGVHNLPPSDAEGLLEMMASYRERRDAATLDDLIHDVSGLTGTLLVFNHPMWDQAGVGSDVYQQAVRGFLDRYHGNIHALELNGMRSGRENQRVVELFEETGIPLVGGGDRHGSEPGAMLNVTNATTFEGFVDEIRSDGMSQVAVMPQYREPIGARVLATVRDVLSDQPEHSLGWTRWSDRIFRIGDDGRTRSYTELFEQYSEPVPCRVFVSLVHLASRLVDTTGVRQFFAKSPGFAVWDHSGGRALAHR